MKKMETNRLNLYNSMPPIWIIPNPVLGLLKIDICFYPTSAGMNNLK
jgi:hypothetical protein